MRRWTDVSTYHWKAVLLDLNVLVVVNANMLALKHHLVRYFIFLHSFNHELSRIAATPTMTFV